MKRRTMIGKITGVTLLILFGCSSGTGQTSEKDATGREGLVIAFDQIRVTGDTDKDSFFVANLVQKILLQRVQEEFTSLTGGFAEVRFLEGPPPAKEDPSAREWAASLWSQGTNYYLDVEFNFSPLGYVLSAQPVNLENAEMESWAWTGSFETAIISGREPDFFRIEEATWSLSERIARIMVGPPKPTILSWCIQAIEPKDPELAFVSRRLTLELPYYLSREKVFKEHGYKFVGLRVSEQIDECVVEQSVSASRELSQYTYVISGTARFVTEGVGVDLWIDPRGKGGSIPLGFFVLKETEAKGLPKELAHEVAEQWDKAILE